MALGSSDEMKVWLKFCEDLGYVSEADAKRLRDEYSQSSRACFTIFAAKWK